MFENILVLDLLMRSVTPSECELVPLRNVEEIQNPITKQKLHCNVHRICLRFVWQEFRKGQGSHPFKTIIVFIEK